MSLQDITADMLTRIRNGVQNHARRVRCLNSKLNRGVVQVLVEEGYVDRFDVVSDGAQGFIEVHLKYGPRGERLINSIERLSKPGRRVFNKVEELPRPLQGMGVCIVSTSRGVMSDRKCRVERVGGEVVAIVT
jgi:small subunit ribosomal protein S8